MRVFCPEHGKGFFAPRQNPIRCENRGHTMGQLDFAGEAGSPVEARWQYCCNCEHFYLIDSGPDAAKRCPACARQFSARYLCDRCYTITSESSMSAQTKNFTLTPEGTPHPACPGCLQAPVGDLREHDCDGLGVAFFTALVSCPICHERLDVAPTFPASVAYYLKRTGNKFNVTFDYESELFRAANDGEFVLVRNGNQSAHQLMLPRLARFSTMRDFYDFYQDSFYCTKPATGEVQVVEPALVEPVEDGWKLKARGVLEVIGDAAVRKPKSDKIVKGEKLSAEIGSTRHCPHCNSVVETRYPFCWHCGKPIEETAAPPIRSTEDLQSLQPVIAEDEITLSPEARVVAPPAPTIFAWASGERPEPAAGGGLAIKLVAVAAVGVALISLLLFVVLRRSSSLAPNEVANNQPAEEKNQSALAAQPPAPTPQTAKATTTSDARPADLELKKFQEKRAGAEISDRAKILESLATAERQYPNDYRFTYERAKLSINPQETHSHHEAFAALLLAARKAVESGKTDEMLNNLRADQDGDFQKLARGHSEWKQLEEALKNKDKSVLTAKLHH